MTEYFRAEWKNNDSINIRYSQSPFFDTYDEASAFAIGCMNNWRSKDYSFRITHTRIEFKDNKRVTTETYYNMENIYVNAD